MAYLPNVLRETSEGLNQIPIQDILFQKRDFAPQLLFVAKRTDRHAQQDIGPLQKLLPAGNETRQAVCAHREIAAGNCRIHIIPPPSRRIPAR